MSSLDQIKGSVFQQLLATHNTGDKSVVERQRQILDLCSAREYTTDELAEYFDMNYYTIYRNIKELVLLGLLDTSPKKGPGGKHLFRTNWSLIRESGEELTWRAAHGEYLPISKYIHRFLTKGKEVSAIYSERFGKALISLKVNRMLQAQGERNYGDSHNRECINELNDAISFFENLIYVMRQAVNSPAVVSDEGWEMYRLPSSVDEKTARAIHDELEYLFFNEDRYDEED